MIGHQGQERHYVALRDVIADGMRKWWSRLRHPEYYTHENLEEFWALKDINLEVKDGERLGIIGRNGAGKTTLLKLLSRITEPTAGQIKIKGRVASLLEVGTGFHPELTGRENVYLNGAILGMTRQEVRRKFDEIIDFAGVEQFLDTPVKRYSSGTQVRLGFAVAAHLEPEILVVDEVLAVGDALFQKKCIGKMSSVAKEGRTVLFVSHQMNAIQNLCFRTILIENGTIRLDASTEETVDFYLNEVSRINNNIPLLKRKDRSGSGEYRVSEMWFTNEEGNRVNGLSTNKKANIHVLVLPNGKQRAISAYISVIISQNGIRLFTLASTFKDIKVLFSGSTEVCWHIEQLPLLDSDYQCSINIQKELGGVDVVDYIQDACILTVFGEDFWGTGRKQAPGLDKLFVDFEIDVKNGNEK